MITLSNTLTGKKEQFTPLKKGAVNLYVCGVTPYDYAHIGHGRVYVTFDVLFRLLQMLEGAVTYCRNFTDIDDKLLHRAQKELGSKFRYQEIAQKYIDAYLEDVAKLGCLTPDSQPRVTETIPGIIQFIEGLIEKGYAYEVDGDVYYRVSRFSSYGKLSKRNLDDLLVGARVELNEKKENPLDFALWKAEDESTFWQSPWGWGRPGWHIECSAMAAEHLAPHIDIHGGGMDLIFPHHENEIAQSEGFYGGTFSRFWVHNAFVRINEEKMSKSLGNFFTLRDVFSQFDPMVVRFYYLQHHYRSPLDFSFDDLQAAEKAYRKLCRTLSGAMCTADFTDQHVQDSPLFKKLVHFVSDDINTVGALGVIFENLSDMQEEQCVVKLFIQKILGLSLDPLSEKIVEITSEIQALLDKREAARAQKDWLTADALRQELADLGYNVQDKK